MQPNELSTEERDEIVERLAKQVVDRRLESVATLFLEMHKPITFLGGQALLLGAPLLGTIFGYENMQKLALFFQTPENVDALLQRIEELSREADQQDAETDASQGGDSPAAPEGSR